MSEREALIQAIVDKPDWQLSWDMFSDWCQDHDEGWLPNRHIKMSWQDWKSNKFNHLTIPFDEVEFPERPRIQFGPIQTFQEEDRANRAIRITSEWTVDGSRYTLSNSISEREITLSGGNVQGVVLDRLNHRARQARTVIGFLLWKWPKIAKWTMPDEIEENPIPTMLLSPDEAFEIAEMPYVRDLIMTSPTFLNDLNDISDYGLPPRLFGLNVVVDRAIPRRNQPFPQELRRGTVEAWLRTPRTYRGQSEEAVRNL